MYTMLQQQNYAMQDDLIAFTKKMIGIPSTSLNEENVANLVEQKMKQLGFDTVFTDEAGNVVGILAGRENKPVVLLNCHMDTVLPSNSEVWDTPPYKAVLKEDKLYGLGAADCKGGLASQIFAAALLKRSLLPLEGTLVVAATVAEENGLSVGVRHLMDKTLPNINLKPDYAILGEPSNLGLYYGHDGWVEIEVRVEGTNPFHVDDAAHEIMNDINLSVKSANDKKLIEEISIMQPLYDEYKGCRRATIRMARRVRESENIEQVIGQIKHNAQLIAQPTGAVAVDVQVRQEQQVMYNGSMTLVRHITNAWSTDPFHPIMDRSRHALAAAGCTVRPGKWELDRLRMGTAGSVLLKEYNVPTIGYGPGCETVAHADNEYVEVDKLSECAYGTAVIVHSLIGVSVFGWTSDEI
ncbi:MAG: M20/M25/M40 family metallo-hydrolase [Candidatus Auribacterota bacterium]|nr:M20/M25/M40 family metallo-hydrolase [Candidatus Auribacterota bacterium]